MRTDENNILHENGKYKLLKENGKMIIVHEDYLFYEAAILFEVAQVESDWSSEMLLESAKKVVDFLGESGFYPDSSTSKFHPNNF